jgi:L-ascorbate metabolism protein UlaG (beta-lactamase superfamily)
MTNPIIDLMRSTEEGIAVCWLGNLGWLLSAEDRFIATDLDLHLDLRLATPPISASEIASVLDIHFITHGHEDHFNSVTSKVLIDESRCRFVVPANCREKALSLGLPESRLHVAVPEKPFKLLGMQVEPLRALHGHKDFSVHRHANLQDCGYVLRFGGKTILQPGDTVLLEQHLDLTDVDVLFVSPTEHNMHIDRSYALIANMRPEHVFPQHFGTYAQNEENKFWTVGFPDELKQRLSEKMRERYHILAQGELFVVR